MKRKPTAIFSSLVAILVMLNACSGKSDYLSRADITPSPSPSQSSNTKHAEMQILYGKYVNNMEKIQAALGSIPKQEQKNAFQKQLKVIKEAQDNLSKIDELMGRDSSSSKNIQSLLKLLEGWDIKPLQESLRISTATGIYANETKKSFDLKIKQLNESLNKEIDTYKFIDASTSSNSKPSSTEPSALKPTSEATNSWTTFTFVLVLAGCGFILLKITLFNSKSTIGKLARQNLFESVSAGILESKKEMHTEISALRAQISAGDLQTSEKIGEIYDEIKNFNTEMKELLMSLSMTETSKDDSAKQDVIARQNLFESVSAKILESEKKMHTEISTLRAQIPAGDPQTSEEIEAIHDEIKNLNTQMKELSMSLSMTQRSKDDSVKQAIIDNQNSDDNKRLNTCEDHKNDQDVSILDILNGDNGERKFRTRFSSSIVLVEETRQSNDKRRVEGATEILFAENDEGTFCVIKSRRNDDVFYLVPLTKQPVIGESRKEILDKTFELIDFEYGYKKVRFESLAILSMRHIGRSKEWLLKSKGSIFFS
jgi:hypothetical protein